MSSTRELSEQQKASLQSQYYSIIQDYHEKAYVLKKNTVTRLRDILYSLNYPIEKICAKISEDLQGEVSETYIKRLLGEEFKDQKYTRKDYLVKESEEQEEPQGSHLNFDQQKTKSPVEMDKDELRSHLETLASRATTTQREIEICESIARKKGIPLLPSETESGSIQNKSQNENESGSASLHSEQISSPKYKITENERVYQDIVIRAINVLDERIHKLRDEFIPSIKINSEEEANTYAQGFLWNSDMYKPATDEKHRLSMIDWMDLVKDYMAHGPSAASKLKKKPIANIEDLDPETLPPGFQNTILALKLDQQTGQVIFVSPTKEHVDSRIDYVLQMMTTFINRTKMFGILMQMLEVEFKRRNFRSAILSEKLKECK